MNVKEYILELLKNGYWVFPIKGKGSSLDEAKQPLTFYEGDEKITWKNEKILAYSEELARKGHQAWGLWLKKSYLFGVDIDSYKAGIDLTRLEQELRMMGIYAEKSCHGGLHIVARVLDEDENKTYRLKSNVEWLEYKHDGYFIIYPSVLRSPSGICKYEKISGDILNPNITVDFLAPVIEQLLTQVGIQVNVEIEEVTGTLTLKNIDNIAVATLGLDVDRLTDEQITALLYLLFVEADCPGLAKAMEYIAETGIVPIKKKMYNWMRIPRTTRWLFQYALASVMAYIGFSPQRTYEYLTSWKFIDEDVEPRHDSTTNAILNVYRYGKLNLIPRGLCPFCPLLVNKKACSLNPAQKIARLPRWKIISIIKFVEANVKG